MFNRLVIGWFHHHQTKIDILNCQSDRIFITLIIVINQTVTVRVLEIVTIADKHIHTTGAEGIHIHCRIGGVTHQAYIQVLLTAK